MNSNEEKSSLNFSGNSDRLEFQINDINNNLTLYFTFLLQNHVNHGDLIKKINTI